MSVGVGTSASLEAAISWQDSFNLTYPVYYDPGNQVFAQFQGLAIPLNVIIDRTQTLAYRRNGFHPTSIHHVLDSLLELPTPIDNITPRPISVPLNADLLHSYPNPFNQSTTIEFAIERTGPVSLHVFDILGHDVAELINQSMSSGSYSAYWNGTGDNGAILPSGPYWIRLQSPERINTHRIVLIR